MADSRQADIDAVLARRHDNGADFWATPDNRIGVGDPFSTITSLVILHELGVDRSHEAAAGAVGRVLEAWREDGRIRAAPQGTMYPCHTAVAARAICRFGCADDPRLERTFEHLLEIQHGDGGWRCKKFGHGRGPETEFANPGVTLWALDAFRFSEHCNHDPALDFAVESLLDHWTVRRPLGPCHFGIGTLFLQTEFPFLRYNLFYWVYVLSFYRRARRDERFREALAALEGKLDAEGRMTVERPHRRLERLSLCRKGEPSEAASRRFREILENLETDETD